LRVSLSDVLLDEAARRFALLADVNRLRILHALLELDGLSGAELAATLGMARPNVSQHLARLLEAGLVGRRRDGRAVRYSVTDPSIVALCDLMCSSLRDGARARAGRLEAAG
jgi:DNA-binding transcriptional ArsR family regulator